MNKSTAILVATIKSLKTSALNEALDILNMQITNIAEEAKNRGKKSD